MPAYHRRPLLITACLLLTVGCAAGVRPTSLATTQTHERPVHVAWCGTLALPEAWLGDTPLGGLSALSWDADAAQLYLLSDRGRVHRARLEFTDGTLTGLVPLASHVLRDTAGHPLPTEAADAESLILERADDGAPGNTRLLIGFEGDTRLQRFSADGRALDPPLRPTGLRGAGDNTGPEALTVTQDHGVIVGLESPPAGSDAGVTRLFSLAGGREWRYPLADEAGSALTDLATEGDDLLALERAFAPPAPLVISLRRAHLGDDGKVAVTDLARLSSGEGWRVDNFEGLVALGDRRYLMVSDDNFSVLQQTLLSCFTLPPAADG
ncbi:MULTISPECIES: esterase-like activity of phytase family protein [Modicisalibacter]|uniref:Esterase-like activity of phytase family protein n=1 Tax=Modicisalibacter tunisiensis TaxID=390637 RepID=A0ABS7WXT7_9GAMM|nr:MULTISPECIES: esterase-like activity of phytase family protein [Modicisalibacter]MBZ9540045.1 esterase-like activity of phytase family protein [Modicisalibacter tunisiensis]MBZ9566561.1 esterase-like activity of phytase family protein [Modicisalibacter tunisiensis]